ncbi:MAG: ImmA/IrrE family metallo-endopeptidase [Phycisphaerae bacterium]|nr:ImmA/IrrE family metallo-endopeptidase [Phycisphaerae bacterium]
MPEPLWKSRQVARNAALAKGEEIAKMSGFATGPVDPFKIAESECGQIHLEGDDFRDAFDGRLSYHDGRFLLIYNTRYNVWARNGAHHPKVRFTVAHELGHYFLDRHREFLVNRRLPIESFTEFESQHEVERQADGFAAGLLMPGYLVSPIINSDAEATVESIKLAADRFDVSLTSMMVRWAQLSHFPCATLCIRDARIQWGFVSDAFRSCGLWKAKRAVAISGWDARAFLAEDSSCGTFREGSGTGWAADWLEGESDPVDVQESYLAIPYSRCMLVFLTAEESALAKYREDDD